MADRPRLVRAIGRWDFTALVVNGVIGSGIFGPESCTASIDGSLANVFSLTPGQLADLTTRPSAYRFELEVGGSWHPLLAIDSGCRTTLPP